MSTVSGEFETLVAQDEDAATLSQAMRAAFLVQVKAAKDTLLRGSDPANLTKYAAEFETHGKTVQDIRTGFKKQESWMSPEERDLLKAFDTGYATYTQAWTKTLAIYKADPARNQGEADAAIKGMDRDAVATLDSLATDLDGADGGRGE
ncbi:MAG: hypothetical protein Q7O66_11510 [Dehalococcoidia bacterium]|nr:hypothetical protein [Dehalococcoidia bacterium]